MAKFQGVYKCDVCGNMVEVLFAGKGDLVCCGQTMNLLEENTVDAAVEKHIPVGEQAGNLLTAKVGSVAHPMTPEHYIQWIEVLAGNKSYKIFLKPGQDPHATFCIESGNEPIVLREYCNLHGLWKG
ncbi:MAG: desulfoferrodoxin [Syntrophomonadaceae bacterium]|nr:desulfoferrodoxin [Syntrophomonadaceae bacterium]